MERQLIGGFIKSSKRVGLFSLVLILPLVFLSLLFRTMAWQAEPEPASVSAGPLAVICDDCMTDVPVYEQTENLVPNPGFETEIPQSGEWGTGGDCSFEWDCSEGHDSNCSAKIYATSADDCGWKTFPNAIDVSSDKYYDFAGWITADFAPGAEKAYILVKFFDENNQPVGGYCETTSIGEDTDWTRVTGRVLAPPEAAHARIICRVSNGSGGHIWFDDVFLGLSINLAVEKEDHPDPVDLGDLLTHTLAYSNVGCEPATGVLIRDSLDEYTEHITSTHSPDIECFYDSLDREVICFDASLGSGERDVITVTVGVSDNTEGKSRLVNEVTVKSIETLVEASDFETTRVPTNGCNVDLTNPRPQPPWYDGEAMHYPYQYDVINTGNHSGTVTLTAECPLGWPIKTDPITATLSGGDSVEAESTVIVSNDILGSTRCLWGITATLTCPLVGETVTDTESTTTTAQRVIGLDISPGTSKPAQRGIGVAFTHTVTNTGNWTDTLIFGCIFDSDLVACTPPIPTTLAKQKSAIVTVLLTDADCSLSMPAAIVVTSTANPSEPVTATDTLTAQYSATLSPGTSRKVIAGTTVYFTHVLTMLSNLGNCVDTFALTATSSQDWDIPRPLPPVTLTLEPKVITVPVDVPSAAEGQATIAVTATSRFSPAIQATATQVIIVGYPPSVDFIIADTTVDIGQCAFFTNTTTGTDPISYKWNFGDSITSTADTETVTHCYTDTGTYTVMLAAADTFGSNVASHLITVGHKPAAKFWIEDNTVAVGQRVIFRNETTGTPSIDFYWAFGDGATSTENSPIHTYTCTGTYTVTLTATSDFGQSLATQPITVGKAYVHLPLVTKNHPLPFANGGFENTLEDGWTIGGNPNLSVTREPGDRWTKPLEGAFMAKLCGDTDKYPCETTSNIPASYCVISQTFAVLDATPVLAVNYRVFSTDVAWSWDDVPKHRDTFEIYLNLFDPEDTAKRRATVCAENRLGTLFSGSGLILCNGVKRSDWEYCEVKEPTQKEDPLEWEEVKIDLTSYIGQDVTIYFAIFNHSDNWFTTWAYLDNLYLAPSTLLNKYYHPTKHRK